MIKKDLVIIGGGCAGLSAAISAYDEGIRDILLLERNEFLGGILNQCIHNGFGLTIFKEELTGPEFASRYIDELNKREIAYKLNTYVTSITKSKVITYENEEEGVIEIEAKAIVLAAGCYERSAGAIGIPGDRPSGVLTAGQAQLFLNEYGYLSGKRIFILGSGDIGLIMARRLTLEGAEVLGVAEICPFSNGLNRNIVQCLEDYNIPLYLSHTVTKIVGQERLKKVVISEVDKETRSPIPGTEKEFECDTLILSIGLIPNNDLLSAMGLPASWSRGALVNESLETPLPGVFSCGNVLHVHDLADNVVLEAAEAGKGAAAYIKGKERTLEHKIEVKAGVNIGYVVPGFIDMDNAPEKLIFKFRVRSPLKDVAIVYRLNGKEIKRIPKPVIIPSEMEIEKLPSSLFGEKNGTLEVAVERK